MPDTIVLLQFGDLGDTILTVPAIRAVRRRFPESRLLLVGKRIAIDFVGGLDLVDDVIEVDKHLFDRIGSAFRPRALLALAVVLRRLRRENADTAVLFHHLVTRWGALKFALLMLGTGAHRRVGLNNGRGWFLTEAIDDRGFGARHESEYWLDVARLIDADGPAHLEVAISDEERAAARQLLAAGGGRRLLAIHPGVGWYGPGRRWRAERFVETARLLNAEEALTCVVVGTDQDAEVASRVVQLLGADAVDLVGKTSVGVLAAVLERCDLLLATDGGVAHLCAAVGTPVVAVFGPSNDRAWRPLTGTVVAADIPCRPCFYRDFERGLPGGCATRECMHQVTPAMVADRARLLLRELALAR
jgi:ADP-heptose:LPS heptosyltransferase